MSDQKPTVLITGAATGGIGGALAKAFAAKGYRVFACVRRVESARALEDLGQAIEVMQLDVKSPKDIVRAREEISIKTGGKLDILVNNAGKATPMPATDLDIEGEVKELFEINTFGVMRMVKEFANLLIAAEGTIVNICSAGIYLPLIYASSYNASKAAVQFYSDTLRVEMKPFNVNVISILPGTVVSNIVRAEKAYLPEDSLYYPALEGWYQRTSREGPLSAGTPANKFATDVVAQVTKSHKQQPLVWWGGKYSTIAWLLTYFLPKGFYDMPQVKKYDLLKLKKQE